MVFTRNGTPPARRKSPAPWRGQISRQREMARQCPLDDVIQCTASRIGKSVL